MIKNSQTLKEKQNFIYRVTRICKTAAEKKVPIFVDAEESWIQDTIDNLTLEMMKKFNKAWLQKVLKEHKHR